MKTRFTLTFESEIEEVPETAYEAIIALNQMSLTMLKRKRGNSIPVYDAEGAEIGTWKVEEVNEVVVWNPEPTVVLPNMMPKKRNRP